MNMKNVDVLFLSVFRSLTLVPARSPWARLKRHADRRGGSHDILCHLDKGEKRTSELKRLMRGITQKMLAQQLRELEADGVVKQTIYEQIPPKVVYSLTDYGWECRFGI